MDDDGGRRSERAQKAALTRAENVEKERRDSERLEQETKGGRRAKHKALEHRVWKSGDKEKANRRTRKERTSLPKQIESSEQHTKKHKKKKEKGGPTADNYNGDEIFKFEPSSSFEQRKVSLAESDGDMGYVSTRPVRDGEDQLYIQTKVKHTGKTLKKTKRTAKTRKRTSITSSDSESEAESESSDNNSDSDSDSESDASSDELKDDRPVLRGDSRLGNTTGSNKTISKAWPPELDDQDASDMNDADNDDVEVPRFSSLAPSLPPTSDIADTSSGYDLAFDMDVDSLPQEATSRKRARRFTLSGESSDGEEVDRPVKKYSKKAKTSRRDALPAERPVIKPSTKPANMKPSRQGAKEPTKSESSSPLVFGSGTSKRIKLKEQPAIIQDILHRGIAKASEDIFFLKTWPEESSRNEYGKGILLVVSGDEKLVELYDKGELSHIKKLLKRDEKFAKAMSDVVVDRLAIVRSPAKTEAAKHIPHYELGLGEKCKARVKSLLENFSFHFPGSWDADQVWKPNDRKEAFLNPVIIDTIRAAYFASSKAVGYRYVDRFSSSIPAKGNEKELPIALLALIMTAIYSCLYEFRNGNQETTDFDGNIFISVNKDIVELLSNLRENKPIEFHKRMHELYMMVINDAKGASTSKPIAAYHIIDFDS